MKIKNYLAVLCARQVEGLFQVLEQKESQMNRKLNYCLSVKLNKRFGNSSVMKDN
jgi:hypothetical protein